MSDSICIITPTPATAFHSSEQWEHVPLSPRLSEKNLSDFNAVLATLSIKNNGSSFTSHTPSDSSSDSESNHRLHTSSKKVCVREDLNTFRKIAPRRLLKPKPIDVPDIAGSKAKWRKPDTPAPWHVAEADGNAELRSRTPSDLESPPQTAIPLRRSPLVPPSPFRSGKITIKRKRSIDSAVDNPLSSLADSSDTKSPSSNHRLDARSKIRPTFRHEPATGIIAVRRLSQLATPRPRSLPMSPRSAPASTALHSNNSTTTWRDRSGSLTPKPGPSILMRSFAYDDLRSLVDEPPSMTPSSWPPVEESSLLRTPVIEQTRPLRTYVDHVRNQRGMAAVQRKMPVEEDGEVDDLEALQPRRSSF
ncbi:unnamed protein product [Zymoseptoria tritici ST99CH_1A5]|uniref:Uncharacterized protein n=1 Tax=Zymoseptoria tritici ST99CH_1A5 TaxID=1276529 RepID=A0A1Y6LH44_ZYMTR|nr:unnamed protein product [Zymoseptoria tritici ST99CH_1A5]